MGTEKARDCSIPPPHPSITSCFPTLSHGACCMKSTGYESALEWLDLFNKFPGRITLGFTANYTNCRAVIKDHNL